MQRTDGQCQRRVWRAWVKEVKGLRKEPHRKYGDYQSERGGGGMAGDVTLGSEHTIEDRELYT